MAAGFCAVIGSVNEIAALVSKAARGAGAPPAQAAQFGKAAVRYLADGTFPEETLIAALEALPEGPIFWLPSQIMHILEESTGRCRHGLILQEAPEGLVECYLQALPFDSCWGFINDHMDVTIDTETPSARFTAKRVTLSESLAKHLQSLAACTFVPESEASRLGGAGAGLTDND